MRSTKPLTSLLRRSAVPLLGLGLVAVVLVVALLAFDIGARTDGAASSLPIIEIGSISVDQGGGDAAPTTSAPKSQGQGTTPAESHGTGAGLGHTGSTGSAATVQTGRTTVVTGEIRIQHGRGYQGGSTTTTETGGPSGGSDR